MRTLGDRTPAGFRNVPSRFAAAMLQRTHFSRAAGDARMRPEDCYARAAPPRTTRWGLAAGLVTRAA